MTETDDVGDTTFTIAQVQDINELMMSLRRLVYEARKPAPRFFPNLPAPVRIETAYLELASDNLSIGVIRFTEHDGLTFTPSAEQVHI